MRRLGASVDWEKERFTMDEGLSDAVHKVFIQLYNEGLIYRGKRLVNWDPVLHTAVSVLHQHSWLDFSCQLKQKSMGRHVTPLGHIILILSHSSIGSYTLMLRS
jgi:hypothetical protein